MLATFAGLPLGIISFLVVANLCGGWLNNGVPIIAGALAGWLVWSHFKRLDRSAFQSLLNPEPDFWPVSLPIAWGIAKTNFDGGFMLASPSGLATWHCTQADQIGGILTARLDFTEPSGTSNGNRLEQQTISAAVRLTALNETTRIEICFVSTTDSSSVESIIRATESRLQEHLEQFIE